MKKILLLTLMTMGLMLVFTNDAYSQRKGKKRKSKTDQYFDDSGDITAKLWYGGNFGNLIFQNGQFGAAVSPMVGFKITDNLSTGLIAKIDYSFFDLDFPGIKNPSLTDFSIGAFTRYRIIPAIFAHVELESTRFAFFTDINGDPFDSSSSPGFPVAEEGKFVKSAISQPYLYTGLGYQSGNGIVGYEISILYNVIDNIDSFRSPFDVRFGLNYNF